MKHLCWIILLVSWLTSQPLTAEATRTILIGEANGLVGVDQVAKGNQRYGWLGRQVATSTATALTTS